MTFNRLLAETETERNELISIPLSSTAGGVNSRWKATAHSLVRPITMSNTQHPC